jgi:hypothetical protein
MKLFYTILFFSFISASTAFGQTKVNYTLSAEAHALMCPFMSPKLMDLISRKGATNVVRDEEMQLHFSTSIQTDWTNEFILDLVDQIGYDPKMFKVTKTYE